MDQGGKLAGLELLAQHTDAGFFVPPFEGVGMEFFAQVDARLDGTILFSPNLDARIEELAEKYEGKSVVVRSNSLRESGEHSFRGIYDSIPVKNVTRKSLRDAVVKVYRSFFSGKAYSYRAKHNITDDAMNPLISRMVRGMAYGVIETTNPSYPPNSVVSMGNTPNAVTEGSGNVFTFEFDKSNYQSVFKSENADSEFLLKQASSVNIAGAMLEQRIGPSTLEFAVYGRRVFFVQRDPLTIDQPRSIEFPASDEKLLGVADLCRGYGVLTLPAVVIGNVSKALQTFVKLKNVGATDEGNKVLNDWPKIAREADERFKEGYILVTPYFTDTVSRNIGVMGRENTSLHGLTPHKKAIITTEAAAPCSHAMTIAREEGLLYAGFEDGGHGGFRILSTASDVEELKPRPLSEISTGDMISLFCAGNVAKVYQNGMQKTNFRKLYPDAQYVISRRLTEGLSVESNQRKESFNPHASDLLWALEHVVKDQREWEFTPFEGVIGGIFRTENGKGFFAYGHQNQYRARGWHLSLRATYWMCEGVTPLPQQEFERILDLYEAHLRS